MHQRVNLFHGEKKMPFLSQMSSLRFCFSKGPPGASGAIPLVDFGKVQRSDLVWKLLHDRTGRAYPSWRFLTQLHSFSGPSLQLHWRRRWPQESGWAARSATWKHPPSQSWCCLEVERGWRFYFSWLFHVLALSISCLLAMVPVSFRSNNLNFVTFWSKYRHQMDQSEVIS